MANENLSIQDKGRIRLITINREAKLNALNSDTLSALSEAVMAFEKDPESRVAILTGAGSKAFVAGADISEFSSFDQEQGEAMARVGQQKVFDTIFKSPKPIIAAINGFALGGGLELAMACHLRVASQTARMGLPEVSLGLIPGYGGTQRLTQLIGRGKALEMILTGDMITADDALALGLVNHVSEPDNLQDLAFKIAEKIAHKSASAVSAAIRAVNASLDPTQDGFEIEISEFGKCFGTPDFEEGVSAFLEKRSPNF